MVRSRIKKLAGIIRKLPPDDPRNPDHPMHRDKWLELARALGRAMADHDWNRMHADEENGGQ
jgi:hypothetical protein